MIPPPPAQIPFKLLQVYQDPEVRSFLDKWLKSTYLMWTNVEKNVGFYGTQGVSQASALTTALTTITHTDPGTPDYAIQNLTTTTPYGFVSQDEGNSVLKVIANLQIRVNELENALNTATGVGLIG